MAAVALASVLAEVHVILFVARQAILFELHLIRWPSVAPLAGEARVRAAQAEPGLLAVIKFPKTPAVG